MKKLLLAILLFPVSVFATNWYVRPNVSGAANGSNWNNAWSLSGINWSLVHAGDTIWMAGGSYSSGIQIGASGSAGSVINILRATSGDSAATSSAGWQSSFDSQVQIPGADGISDTSFSHWLVDGRTQYGILITIPFAGGYGVEIDSQGAAKTDITVRNVDILGNYATPSNPSPEEAVGFKIDPGDGSLSNMLIDHCRIRGCATGLHMLITNLTIQYSIIQDVIPCNSSDHADIAYAYPSPGAIWRYNVITNCQEDGIFSEYAGQSNWYFYGNVCWNLSSQIFSIGDKSSPGTLDGPFFIYNNVFAAPSASDYGVVSINSSNISSSTQIYDNVWWDVTNDIEGGTSDYNAYNYTSLNGFSRPTNEKHSFTFSDTPFNSPSAGDFHLTTSGVSSDSQFANGLALTANGFINKDMDGNTRGNPWFIGACQYEAGVPETGVPAPPTNLRVLPPTADERTLQEALKNVGYQTSMVRKW